MDRNGEFEGEESKTDRLDSHQERAGNYVSKDAPVENKEEAGEKSAANQPTASATSNAQQDENKNVSE